MRRWFLILCFACLAFILVGCGSDASACLDVPEQLLSSSSEEQNISSDGNGLSYGKLVDKRDSAVYRTVKIGEQVWMAENLNYETEYSFCYNDSLENCKKYGRLYYWSAAMDSAGEFSKNARGCGLKSDCNATEPVRGICPEGWHLPSREEGKILVTAVGGKFVAGEMLKSTGEWPNENGKDLYGFSMLPSGMYNENGEYLNIGAYAYFWTSCKLSYGGYPDRNNTYVEVVGLLYDYTSSVFLPQTMNVGLPVRCLKDYVDEGDIKEATPSVALGVFTDSRDNQEYITVAIGKQVWMAQNLNYECKRSYCYDNAFNNCDRYGRFYDWGMAQDICPKGWHLPDTTEWNELFVEVGGKKNAGTVLRSANDWNRGNKGSNKYGFSVLPAGYRNYDGSFGGAASKSDEEYAFFWTSADGEDDNGYFVYMTSEANGAGWNFGDKKYSKSVRCVRDEPASSSSEKVSSSSEGESSSSESSSSSVSRSSSSGKTVNRIFLWDGTVDLAGIVETGSPDETSGYWYDFSDRDVGGSSRFIFPSDVEEREDGNFYGPLVEYYMGIWASVSFGDDYDPPYQPYVGLGFNVWSENQEGVDVSAWGGICLTYQSTIAFSIELGIENEATITDYVSYHASVPVAKSVTVIDFPWSKFKTGVWGPGASIEDVLKKVAAIKLKFEGEAGTTGDFYIQKIGSLGQCESLGLL